MQKKSIYNLFKKSNQTFRRAPRRLLKFKHSKWLFIKSSLTRLLKKRKTLKNYLLKVKRVKRWIRIKHGYKKQIETKRLLLSMYGKIFTFADLKKQIKINNLKKIQRQQRYLVFPFFRVDILLCWLFFSPSTRNMKQYINTKYFLINGKLIKKNIILKRGDVISLNFNCLIPFNIKKNFKKYLLQNHIFSFLEIDYYSLNIILLKDIRSLSENDTRLIMTKFLDITIKD